MTVDDLEPTGDPLPSATSQENKRQTLFALGWSSIGTVIMFGANGLAVVVLSRLVEPKAFGVIAAATAVGMILRGIGPLAVIQATLQAGDRPGVLRAGTNVAWVLTAILAVVLFVGADAIGGLIGLGDDSWVLRAWPPILLCQGVMVPAQVVLQRALRFKEITLVQSSAALVGSAIVPIVLASMGLGLGALYFAALAQAVIELVGLCVARGTVTLPGRRASHTREVVHGTRTFATLFAVSAVSTQGDNLIVSARLGSDALGFYSRAYKLMALPANMFGDAIDTVLFPVIIRARDDRGAVFRGTQLATSLLSLVIFPVSALSIVLGGLVVEVLLGSQWLAAVTTFQILAIGMFFRIAAKPLGTVLRGLGHQRALTAATACYAAGIVAAAVIGCRWGIEGVAVGVVVVLVVYFVGLAVLTMRLLEQPVVPMLAVALIGLPGALVCGLVAYGVSSATSGLPTLPRLIVSAAAGAIPAALVFLHPRPRASVRSLISMRGASGASAADAPAS